jgi:hypothetical protein
MPRKAAGSKRVGKGSSTAVDSAVQAARDGAADAKATVDRVVPAVSQFVSRFVYTTTYSLSYGIVFPALLVARAIPTDNALVHGLVDGAQAARDMVEDWQFGTSGAPAHRPAAIH